MGHCKLKLTIYATQVKCWFLRRGENRSNRSTQSKASQCRVENQQTQPTYDADSGNRSRATLVGGECCHHCAIPAPTLESIQTSLFFFSRSENYAVVMLTRFYLHKKSSSICIKACKVNSRPAFIERPGIEHTTVKWSSITVTTITYSCSLDLIWYVLI